MSRKTCRKNARSPYRRMALGVGPILIVALGAGLVVTSRRLRQLDAELERLRAELAASERPPAAAKPPAGEEVAPADGNAQPSDYSAEWEQAVPPMDS